MTQSQYPVERWRVSLHGGHTGEFSDHALGSLRETLDAAVATGYRIYGVAEHAAREEERFLYPEERAMGWDIEKVKADFAAYARTVRSLAGEYADRITVLCGFEADNIPADCYAERARNYQSRYGFDYVVGSTHYVDEILIDGHIESFERALAQHESLEQLIVHYYQCVAALASGLRPDVIGHFDVIRKHAHTYGACDTPAIREAAFEALEAVREAGSILDLNTGGYRKGLGTPYPAPWIVQRAHERGIPFCFGDDSHAPDQVGLDLERSRAYLLENGVRTITALNRKQGEIVREVVSLD